MTTSALLLRLSAAPTAFPRAATFGFTLSLSSYIPPVTSLLLFIKSFDHHPSCTHKPKSSRQVIFIIGKRFMTFRFWTG